MCVNEEALPRDRDAREAILAATRSHEAEFIGLTEEEATALADRLGLQLRVIRNDHTGLTFDLRHRRMTLDLRTGRVTHAKAG